MAKRKVQPAPQSQALPREEGTTGRFVPCVAAPWVHPGARSVHEVKWSVTRKASGKAKTNYYYRCGFCGTRVFLHGWDHAKGFTVVEAESQGFLLVEVDDKRKRELLKELGLEPVPMQGFPPAPPQYGSMVANPGPINRRR